MIINPARAGQLIDFADMKYGLCSPTDIDLTIDFKGKTFVYAELKLQGKQLTQGQRIYLSNVVKSHFKAGNHAVGIFAWHNQEDPTVPVQAKDAHVIQAYGRDFQWVNVADQEYSLDEYIKKVYTHHLDRNGLQY